MSTIQVSDVQVTGQGEPVLSIAPASTARDLLPIFSDSEFMSREWKPPVMLIDELLEKGSCTMVSGPSGSCKTACLMEAGIALSTGTSFAGQLATAKAHKVLFLAIEAPWQQYEKQYRRMLRGRSIEGDTGLHFVSVRTIDLLKPEWAHLLEDRVLKGGFDVVLLDTLVAVSSAKENDNSEMAMVMAGLTGLCNNGVTVGFVHHTGKPNANEPRQDKYRSRGASAIPASCDIEWRVALTGDRITLKCLKSRGDPAFGTEHALVMGYNSDEITLRYDPSGSGLEKVLLDALKRAGHTGLFRAQLIEVAEAQLPSLQREAIEQRVKRSLRELVKAGKVRHAVQGAPYVAA